MPALPLPADMPALPPPEAARESAPPPPPQGRVPLGAPRSATLSDAPTLRAATTLVQQMASNGASSNGAASAATSDAASVAVGIMNSTLPDHIHVLVVDGDRTSLEALESSLLEHSYKVTTCSEGTKALSMLQKGEVEFHLVLSEAYLPDMGGCEFLDYVTSETDIPIIMMSSETDYEDYEAEAHAAIIHMCFGARAHRRKPLHETVIQDLWQFVMRTRLERMMGPGPG